MSKEEVKSTKKSTSTKSGAKKGSAKSSTKKTSTVKSATKKPAKKATVKKTVKVDDSITLEEADSFYHVSLLAQAVCVVGVLFFTILAIFEHSFTVPIETLVGVTLLIMAFNNMKVFKRKGLTIVYIIFGIICLFVGIMGYFGANV
jgi:hypothetical protein